MSRNIQDDALESVVRRGLNAVIDLLSSFFLPIINLLVSTGILKGIFKLLLVGNVITRDSSTYAILNGMADALFYFIPVFLAYTASKRFGVDTVTGMLIGCILLYPSITAVMASSEPAVFFGFELSKVTYVSSVIPILLAIYATSWIQKICYRVISETFRGLFTPPICIIVIIPVTLIVFGPLSKYCGWLACYWLRAGIWTFAAHCRGSHWSISTVSCYSRTALGTFYDCTQ